MKRNQTNAQLTRGSSVSLASLGLGFLAISVLPATYLVWAFSKSYGGNDFGAHGMYLLAVIVAFALVSPLMALTGTFLVFRYTSSFSMRFLGVVAALPTVLILLYVPASALIPKPPVYNPNSYQHLVGRNIDEIKTELDTTGAKSGTSRGDGKTRYLSLRGMDIIADADGTIRTVKSGHRR